MENPKLSQSEMGKSIIKFIDVLLDLYSPVPYEVRNEMRILQNTLLYGHAHELAMYMEGLTEKLELKQRSRHYQNYNSQNSGHSNGGSLDVHAGHSFDKSVDKMTRIKSNSSLIDYDCDK